jgi:hypothetical protein
MPILVTVSVNLAESVKLRDLQQFVQAAERNGADPDKDLREYDENNDLVGLAAIGEMGPSGGGDAGDGDGDGGGEDGGDGGDGDGEGSGDEEGDEEGDEDEEGGGDESPQQS